MQRWLLGLAVLLAGTVSLAHADYIVIVANVGATKEKPQAQGQFGGNPFAPGGGAQGPLGAGQGPRGGQGAQGGMMPPGMGNLGGSGAMMPPGMGNQGGMGAIGGFGGFQQPGGAGTGQDDIDLAGVFVVAVVESQTPVNLRSLDAGFPVKITHKWGTSLIMKDKEKHTFSTLPLVDVQGKPLPNISKKWEAKTKEVHDKKDATPPAAALLDLAEWALQHGMLTEFTKTMDELAQADKESAVVKAYLQVKADLAKPAARNNDYVSRWKSRLSFERYQPAEKEKGHYTLVHNNPSNDSPEVQGRLNRLEDNLQTFFYWFALRGKVMSVPGQRLIAIMPATLRDFESTKQKFDAPVVADGFFAHRDNIAVLAHQRLDPQYDDLFNVVRANTQQLGDPMKLLKGQGDPALQTMMLMLKTLEEDGELATASHDGTRQLLAATGLKVSGEPERPLLPRSVAAPEWIQFGMGSVFETPSSSPWVNVGLPSVACMPQYNYMAQFQEMGRFDSTKMDKPPVALMKVITDQYFREASSAKDKEQKAGLLKARTLAWSVTYFLTQKKLDGVLRYFKELDKLPRDLEFDNDVLLGAFARAFDLTDPRNPAVVDNARFASFAQEWRGYITNLPDDMKDIVKEVRSILKAGSGTPNQPGAGNPNAPAGPAGPGRPGGS
jgi:hypothetical protein